MTFSPQKARKPMKRSEIKRKSWMARGTKELPKVNVRQQAKRRKAYANYLRTKVWKAKRAACIARAGNQCEVEREYLMVNNHGVGIAMSTTRCWETEQLTAHHLTYARFGGDELPSDLQCVCADCHRRIEALKGKRAPLRSQEGA